MTSKASMISSFIESAPPGELADVVTGEGKTPALTSNCSTDIKSLTSDDPSLLQSQTLAFKKYNEEQLLTTKLPGGSQSVIISKYNSLDDDRYYDVESMTSFHFDQQTRTASAAQSYSVESEHLDFIKSLHKSLSSHASEHYPSSTLGIFPTDNDQIAVVLAANKYSPNNFWNGRWRATYVLAPASSSTSITGTLYADVHYYEDGNVRLLTSKPVSASVGSAFPGTASEVARQIAAIEKRYQEELNRAFNSLSEGAFKGLRRQLPVTRQRIEWDKVGGYRLGQDVAGGGRQR